MTASLFTVSKDDLVYVSVLLLSLSTKYFSRYLCVIDKNVLKLIVFWLLLLLDSPELGQAELHADTDQSVIKQIK